MASQARLRGNQLFAAGDYNGAAEAYAEGLTAEKNAEKAVLLVNSAACRLKLNDLTAAASECRAALAIDPTSPKGHYRLAQALPRDAPAAAVAVCAAVSLWPPPSPPELLALYTEVAEALGVSAEFELPDVSRVAGAASNAEAAAALSRGSTLVVLRPGVYRSDSFSHSARGNYAVVGLGDCTCASQRSHAVFANGFTVALMNVRLIGCGDMAAACVAGGGKLRLVDCRVESYSDVGVLASGGTADLLRCSFRRVITTPPRTPLRGHSHHVKTRRLLLCSARAFLRVRAAAAVIAGAQRARRSRCGRPAWSSRVTPS